MREDIFLEKVSGYLGKNLKKRCQAPKYPEVPGQKTLSTLLPTQLDFIDNAKPQEMDRKSDEEASSIGYSLRIV